MIRVPLPDGRSLECGRRTLLMGVLNVTPDSFSDGGLWVRPDRALRRARSMARAGADLIDVGGESTRPGAPAVPVREELRRVVPVIEALAAEGFVVSIDTSKGAVAEAAFRAGAQILNDVTALRDRRAARAAADAGAAVVLMHMKGTPRTMQRSPRYGDVVRDLAAFFRSRLDFAFRAGIGRDKIFLDPGIGFGKTAEHSMEILRRLGEFRALGRPLVVGPSRKSFLNAALGDRVPGDRVFGTAAAVAAAVIRGADVVRVHDVREMCDVIRVSDRLK
jgi:dihydropteroate synthase